MAVARLKMVGFSKFKKFLKLEPFVFKIDTKNITYVTCFAPKKVPFSREFLDAPSNIIF